MRTSGLEDDAVSDGDPGNAGSGRGCGRGLLQATSRGAAGAYWVVVRVNEALPALFGPAFARGGLSPGAIATGGVMGSAAAGSCIYVLDPSAANAFLAGNGASVTVGCGVYVDSNNAGSAMYVTGGAT